MASCLKVQYFGEDDRRESTTFDQWSNHTIITKQYAIFTYEM